MQLRSLVGILVTLSLAACSDVDVNPQPAEPGTSIPTGDLCLVPESSNVRLRFQPDRLAIATGTTRNVRLVVEPDFCSATELTFRNDDENVTATPDTHTIDYGTADVALPFEGLHGSFRTCLDGLFGDEVGHLREGFGRQRVDELQIIPVDILLADGVERRGVSPCLWHARCR